MTAVAVPPFVIHANLDCEASWAGAPLPPAVARRVSHYAALLAALAPADRDVEVWAPAPVERARLLDASPWRAPTMRTGSPPRADLAWAASSAAARAANDRRLALAVATAHRAALPGQRTITSPDEIDLPGPWIAKAPWTAAGRDRCRGEGPPTAEQRTRLERLLARSGALLLEPWCDRMVDAGVCATVAADGTVTAYEPHSLLTDARGGFLGIDLAPPALEPAERSQLSALTRAAGDALAGIGYTGPFAVDAFAYRSPTRSPAGSPSRRFHPLCEINARYTFGWIARALAARVGARRLGFGPPPDNARILIAPAADGVTAWCA